MVLKIILSPSKTQNNTGKRIVELSSFLKKDMTLKLFSIIKSLTENELETILHIRGKLLHSTYNRYQSTTIDSLGCEAIECYKGVVFEQIDTSLYNQQQQEYLNKHVIVLSAMYGVLQPRTVIWPYRLDMTILLKNQNLYHYWQEVVDEYFSGEDVIINLASNEFSKMIGKNRDKLITIYFQEEQEDKIMKTISYNVKKARGKMTHQLILDQISNPIKIQEYQIDGYLFDDEISDEKNYYFIKRIE